MLLINHNLKTTDWTDNIIA